MRSDYCGEITEAKIGRTVTVCGWVHYRRDLGGLIFLELRDRSGLVQAVFTPGGENAALFKIAELSLRHQDCRFMILDYLMTTTK